MHNSSALSSFAALPGAEGIPGWSALLPLAAAAVAPPGAAVLLTPHALSAATIDPQFSLPGLDDGVLSSTAGLAPRFAAVAATGYITGAVTATEIAHGARAGVAMSESIDSAVTLPGLEDIPGFGFVPASHATAPDSRVSTAHPLATAVGVSEAEIATASASANAGRGRKRTVPSDDTDSGIAAVSEKSRNSAQLDINTTGYHSHAPLAGAVGDDPAGEQGTSWSHAALEQDAEEEEVDLESFLFPSRLVRRNTRLNRSIPLPDDVSAVLAAEAAAEEALAAAIKRRRRAR